MDRNILSGNIRYEVLMLGVPTARTHTLLKLWFLGYKTQKFRKSPADEFDEFKVLRCGIVLHSNYIRIVW